MILIISLERSPERRQTIAAALDGLDLPFRFVDAVDAGRDALAPVAGAEEIRARTHRDLSQGEIACALSHRKAYETFLASDAGHAVFLEDDALPTPAFARFTREGGHERHPMVLYFHSGARVLRGPGAPAGPGHSLYRLAMSPNGAVAYSLDRASAHALLQANTPVACKADWPMDLAALGALVTVPPMVGHPDRAADPGQSLLAAGRPRSGRPRFGRFFTPAYYRRKLIKLTTRKVS